MFSLMVHVIGDCTPRRTCGLCRIAIHFEGCGQNSSITLTYWRSRPKSIEQNLVKMSFSLIRLQKENLNAQIGNEKCWRQQRCRKETGTYGRPQIEHESRLHRKVISYWLWMDAIGKGLLFCYSGGGLEPGLGTVLKKMTGKKRQGGKNEIQRKTVRFKGENIKYWEDGVHFFPKKREG